MGDEGILAIDDIDVGPYSDKCGVQPSAAVAWGCNFETGTCKWGQSKDDDYDWMWANKGKGANPQYTPYMDHTTGSRKLIKHLTVKIFRTVPFHTNWFRFPINSCSNRSNPSSLAKYFSTAE